MFNPPIQKTRQEENEKESPPLVASKTKKKGKVHDHFHH